MGDRSSDGVTRLRKSGIGVIVGGILLAVGTTVLPFAPATAAVFVVGVVGLVRGDGVDSRQAGLGVAAVGAIGLLEAAPGVGLGLEPATFAALAIAFGVFDVLAGLVLGWVQPAGGE